MSEVKSTMTLGEAVKAMRAASARPILSLPPVLQAVWTATYQAVIQGEHMALADPEVNSFPVITGLATRAEQHAWEAVRRANGGEMPEEREPLSAHDADSSRLAILKEAVEQPCSVTGEPFFMVLKHPDLGWVPTYGGPYDSYTAPEKDEDGELSRWRYDHDSGHWTEVESMCLRVVDADAEQPEPTDEEMIEALAPIVAILSYGSIAWRDNTPFHESWIEQARRCLGGVESTWTDEFRKQVAIASASWKAARAWGRK